VTGDAERAAELQRVPPAVERALELEPASRQIAEMYRGMSRCVVLGRGYNYTSAHPGPSGAAGAGKVTLTQPALRSPG